jgi:hypothetical protein
MTSAPFAICAPSGHERAFDGGQSGVAQPIDQAHLHVMAIVAFVLQPVPRATSTMRTFIIEFAASSILKIQSPSHSPPSASRPV